MTPLVKSVASASAAGTPTSLTIAKPAGTVSGDLLVAILEWYPGNFGSLPAGWTAIDTLNQGGTAWGDGGAATAYKIAGGSEPSSYTFTLGNNGFSLASGAQGTIARITGHDPTTPINAHALGPLDSSSPFTTPSVTTTTPDALVLHGWGAQNPAGGVTWNTPVRVTLVDRQGSSNGTMLMVAREIKSAAGATTGRDATASSAYATWASQIAIAPAASSPTGPVYVDAEEHVNSTTNAHVGSYAGTLAAGDILVAIIIADNVNVGFDTLKPAGWVFKGESVYGDPTNTSTAWRAHVLTTKLANGATHSWTFTSNFGGSPSGNLNTRILMHRFAGADLPEAFTILGGRDNALTIPSLTSGGGDRLLVAWGLGTEDVLNFDPAAGMTEVYDVLYASPTAKVAMDTEARGAGATGSRSLTSPVAPFGGTRTLGTMLLLPPPDTTGPTLALTAPADGSTVSGTIALTATASDPAGVASVQFSADGVNVGAPDTTSPYSTTLDTTTLSEGVHTISAVATDSNGNTSAVTVTVTVDNVAALDAGASTGDVWLGPILFDTVTGEVAEQLGDALDAAGAVLTPADRRPRPFKLTLPVRGVGNDRDDGYRLRRQVRQLLDNGRWRGQGLYFHFGADPELDGWLQIGGGDLTETDAGITFGDWTLELTDCYVVGRPNRHRLGRRLELGDRRTGLVALDTRGYIYSTDHAGQALAARPLVIPGTVDSVLLSRNRPPTSITDGPIRAGRVLWRELEGAIDGDVASFLPTLLEDGIVTDPALEYVYLEPPGSVRVWDTTPDTIALDPAAYTAAGDNDPTAYGWQRIYGDPPVRLTPLAIDNGACRLVWLGADAAGGIALERRTSGGTYERLGRLATAVGLITEASVIELSPERAVIEWRAGQRALRIVLQRGWYGPRVEAYNDQAAQAAIIEWIPQGGSAATITDQVPTWVKRLDAASGTHLLAAPGTADSVITAVTDAGTQLAGAGYHVTRNDAVVVQLAPVGTLTSAELASLAVTDARSVPVLISR